MCYVAMGVYNWFFVILFEGFGDRVFECVGDYLFEGKGDLVFGRGAPIYKFAVLKKVSLS